MQALILGSIYAYGARQFYKKDKAAYDKVYLKDVKHPGDRPDFGVPHQEFSDYLEELERHDDADRRARSCAMDRSLIWPVAIVWDAVFA